MSCGLARQELYAPRSGPIDIAQWSSTVPPQTIRVTTSDQIALNGYFWPGAPGDKDIFVFFHGRGAHHGVAAKYAQYLRGRGDAVLVASYRGFGGNPGSPDRAGIERDAAAFIQTAHNLAGENARIWLLGHSLGAAVAIDAAAGRHDIAGIITIGAFATLSAAAPWYARPFVPERWNNVEEIKRIHAPLLIVQGDKDRVIPGDSGARLAAAVQGPVAYISMKGETHKPPMQTLGPWLSAAIATMNKGQAKPLPALPANWTVVRQTS